MTEQPPNMSNNAWNPANKEFWGTNPDTKLNVLFATAMIGLMISFVGFMWWGGGVGRFPTFHAFFLLLTVKMKNRPTLTFRILLVLLGIWGGLKCLFMFWVVYMNYYLDGDLFQFFFIESLCLLLLFVTNLILWKQTQMNVRESKVRMWHPEIYLFVVFSISILQIINSYSEVDYFFYSREAGIAKALSFGPLIFWSSFALLYVYRTEIEPWKENIDPLNHGVPKEQYSGTIDAYTAGKLLEAKELLDKGVISMEEFLEIKKEAIGSNEVVDELVPTIHDIKTEDKKANKDIEGGSSKMKELKELTEMKEKGLISDDEYEKMKKEIIS